MPDVSDYRQQGDLAIWGFERLISKYDRRVYDVDDDELSNLSHESLPTHCQNLFIARPDALIDYTLGQIRYDVHTLCPDSPHPSGRPEDQNLKEFKLFRLGHLYHLSNFTLLDGIVHLFKSTIETIQRLGLSNCMLFVCNTNFSAPVEQTNFWLTGKREINHADSVLETIDRVIRWLKGSELDLIQHGWPRSTRSMADITAQIFGLIYPTTAPKDARKYPYPISNAVIHLGKSILPILKLSRIFINKLTKRGMNTNRLPLFTRMRTDQLVSLAGLPGELGKVLSDILSCLQGACTTARSLATIGSTLTRLARKLQECFEYPLVLITEYFIPLIPDPDDQDRNYFTSWFATWPTELELAVCNLTNAAQIFNQNPRNLRFSIPRIA
ncbi:hypothetical protein KEM48_009098 [Puccinia striiformis f. sp. tritici PST-130]|nr:hypothetical protein KEM48_009098 [Puccinia striiformis f. sp. tritici PST-130]